MASIVSFKRRFITRVQNSKKMTLLSTLIGVVVAIIYSYFQSPLYTATATIEVGFEPNTLHHSMLVETKTNIIKSNFLLQRAFAKVDLSHYYYEEIDYKKQELYRTSPFSVYLTKGHNLSFSVLAQDDYRYQLRIKGKDWEYDSIHRYGQRVSSEHFNLILRVKEGRELGKNPYGFVVYSQDIVLQKVQEALGVEQVGNSAIIALSYSDSLPSRAKDFLVALVDVALKDSKKSTPRVKNNALSLSTLQLGEKLPLKKREDTIQQQIELFKALSQNIDTNKTLTILSRVDTKYRELLLEDIVEFQRLRIVDSNETNSSTLELREKITTQIATIEQKLKKEKSLMPQKVQKNIPKKLQGDRSLDILASIQKRDPLYGLFILLGAIFGFLFALLLLTIQLLLSSKVRSFVELKNVMETTLIGVVPHSKKEYDEEGVLIPSLMFTESFRTIRNNLSFMPKESASQVIAITAPKDGEGRGTIITNLAEIMSLNNQRVVVLDIDMQQALLHKKFNLFNDEGMSSVLSNSMMISQVIRSTDNPNLDVVTAGPFPPNLWELIHSNRMEDIVQKLRNVYDVILIHKPYIETDANKFLSCVDTTLYILRAKRTHLSFIQEVDRLNKETKGFAVILNDVKR